VTTGCDPTAPGGTPRSPRSSGRDWRRRKRPGESGGEIADIGAICRTEAILNALAATRACEREPARGQSGAAGKSASEAPGGMPGNAVSGGGTPGAAESGGAGSGGAVIGSGLSGGDLALAVLAALAADVDEQPEPPCLHDRWQDDACLRQIRAVYADSTVQGSWVCPAVLGIPGIPPVTSITDRNHLRAGPSRAWVCTRPTPEPRPAGSADHSPANGPRRRLA